MVSPVNVDGVPLTVVETSSLSRMYIVVLVVDRKTVVGLRNRNGCLLLTCVLDISLRVERLGHKVLARVVCQSRCRSVCEYVSWGYGWRRGYLGCDISNIGEVSRVGIGENWWRLCWSLLDGR